MDLIHHIIMKKPSLSISTCFNYDVPIEEQIPAIAEAGFTHLSLGENAEHSGYLTQAGQRRLKTLLQQYGLSIDTIHGPHLDSPDSLEQLAAVTRAALELGAPVVVVHPGPFDFPTSELPVRLEAVLSTCTRFEHLGGESGVRFAIENVQPGPATQLALETLRHLNPQYFGACYDSSHEQIGGPRPFDYLSAFKDRLFTVHLSDRIREFVDHVPPGEGFIDWQALTSVLRSSNFKGPWLFEVMVKHASQRETRAFLARAYHQASWVSAMIEGE